METEQEREWAEAQKISFSVDLVDAAKKQLEFLAVVDRNRHLYEGPAVQWAIFRYNAYWIPLLAKHSENPLSEEPLVVPLDCEWIWHCHRLNPIRYKLDCEKLYGRILDNDNVISSVQGKLKNNTKEIWNTMYPEEPYELEVNRYYSQDIFPRSTHYETFTKYDLVSAVTRQSTFYSKVSKPYILDDQFLQQAVARYKGLMHLIRTNRRKNIITFCVPTHDIDLIWHSHQRHPVSYCADLIEIVGEVVGHDDSVKGEKMENGFFETTKQYEEIFRLSYKKKWVMCKGATPTPVPHTPFAFNSEGKEFDPTDNCGGPHCSLINYSTVASVKDEVSSGDYNGDKCVVSCEIRSEVCNADCGAAYCGATVAVKSQAPRGVYSGGKHGDGYGIKGEAFNGDCGAAYCGAAIAKKSEVSSGYVSGETCGAGCGIKSEVCNGGCGAVYCGANIAVKSEMSGDDYGGGKCSAGKCGAGRCGAGNGDIGNSNAGYALECSFCAGQCVDSSMVNESIAA